MSGSKREAHLENDTPDSVRTYEVIEPAVELTEESNINDWKDLLGIGFALSAVSTYISNYYYNTNNSGNPGTTSDTQILVINPLNSPEQIPIAVGVEVDNNMGSCLGKNENEQQLTVQSSRTGNAGRQAPASSGNIVTNKSSNTYGSVTSSDNNWRAQQAERERKEEEKRKERPRELQEKVERQQREFEAEMQRQRDEFNRKRQEEFKWDKDKQPKQHWSTGQSSSAGNAGGHASSKSGNIATNKSSNAYGSVTYSDNNWRAQQAERERKEEEKRKEHLRELQEEEERQQREFEAEMKRQQEEFEHKRQALAAKKDQNVQQHQRAMQYNRDQAEASRRENERQQNKILLDSANEALQTTQEILNARAKADREYGEHLAREAAKNEEFIKWQQQNNSDLQRQSEARAKERAERQRRIADEDRRFEDRLQRLEKQYADERARADEKHKRDMEAEERRRKADAERRKEKMEAEERQREEERERKHEEWLKEMERQREERARKHQERMKYYADREEEYIRQRREREEMKEHERREFEETIRRIREERMRRQRDFEDYLRRVNLTISSMLAMKASDYQLQAKYSELCRPLESAFISIESAFGNLTNWIRDYSKSAGFLDVLLAKCNEVSYLIESFKDQLDLFFDAIQHAPIPPVYQNWLRDIINRAQVTSNVSDSVLNRVKEVRNEPNAKANYEVAQKLHDAEKELKKKFNELTMHRVYSSQERQESSPQKDTVRLG